MQDLTTAIKTNPTYVAAKAGAYAYLGFALYESFSHIVELSVRYGCTDPWVSPLLVDSLMLLGKLIRSSKVTKRTRVVGGCLQAFGAVASLAANILAGQTVGDRVQGAGVIIGFLVVELVVEWTKPIQVDEAAELAAREAAEAAERAAKKAATIAKAKATRDANKAAAAAERAAKAERAAERAERRQMAREIAEIEAKANQTYTPDQNAPVSPAPAGTHPGYL